MSPQNTSVSTDLQTGGNNESIPEGCIRIRFSEWEYLPWNNSDNIVSRQVLLNVSIVRVNVLMILFLIGGPANVINMAVFYKQGLKDRVNLLLFSLSLADEICLCGSVIHVADAFYNEFTGDVRLSSYRAFVINNHIGVLLSSAFVSFVLSAIVACERCYCVLRPLKYHSLIRTERMALIILALYCVIPGLFVIVTYRYYVTCVHDLDSGAVTIMFSDSNLYRHHKVLIDNLDSIFFGVGLPCVVMVVSVTATVITITKLRQAMAWRTETASSVVSAKEVALTKMLVGTSVLLIVCVFPNCLLRVACLFLPELNSARRHENLYVTFVRITHMLFYVNSSFNIFVYYTMGTRYRDTLWALFSRKADCKGTLKPLDCLTRVYCGLKQRKVELVTGK